MTPEVEFIAWDKSIEFQLYRLPIPEPSITDREDNCRDGETPDEEINTDMPAWVDGATIPTYESEVEDKRVVEQRKENLNIFN